MKKRFLGKLREKCKESARERERVYTGRRREEEGQILHQTRHI